MVRASLNVSARVAKSSIRVLKQITCYTDASGIYGIILLHNVVYLSRKNDRPL